MDKHRGKKITNFNSQTLIKNWLEDTYLEDIWRTPYPNDKIYTWNRNKLSDIFSRLDLFLISFGFAEKQKNPK